VGGTSRTSASVTVGATTVTGNGADLDGFGDGRWPRSGTFHEPTVVVAGGENGAVLEPDGT